MPVRSMKIADYIKTKINEWPNWLNLILLRCNIFGSLVYGRSYARLRRRIDELDPERQLLEMVNFAIKNVPYYRNRYGSLHVGSIEEFEQNIGFIDKQEVMTHWEEFLVDGINKTKCVEGTTGGTSGRPLKLVLPADRWVHTSVFAHKAMESYGWHFDAYAVIRNHKMPEGRDYMINPVLREFIFDAFRMSEQYAARVLSVMRKHRVRYIFAYPSGAYQFLKLCRKQGLDVSFIKLCMLSSEGVTDEQRYFIETELGIPIYANYGHSEKLIRAVCDPYSSIYRIEENHGYCELVDKHGMVVKSHDVVGEMVGTTFINRYMPLIRYRTGDYAAYAADVECLSDTAPRRLSRIEGRWDKNLIYRVDGTTVTTTSLNLHGKVYEHIDGLQYVQNEKGRLQVSIIRNDEFTDDDLRYLQCFYSEAMLGENNAKIEFVDKLIFCENGKFLQLISKVS